MSETVKSSRCVAEIVEEMKHYGVTPENIGHEIQVLNLQIGEYLNAIHQENGSECV